MSLSFLSLACALVFAQVAPANEQLEAALNKAESVIAKNLDDFAAHNTRGNVLKSMGSYEKSIVAFSTAIDAIEKEANANQAPHWAAVLRLLRGDTSGQEQALQFQNRKMLATVLGNRADAYRNLIDKLPPDKAKIAESIMFDDLTRSIQLHPEDPVYLLARGQQNYYFKQFPQALADFSEVLKQQPKSMDAFRGRILSAYELKNWDVLWRDAQAVRDLGTPIDESTLAKWRKESGRNYPDAKQKPATDVK
jgi:tetratricopeptide (TPR) repeat protein